MLYDIEAEQEIISDADLGAVVGLGKTYVCSALNDLSDKGLVAVTGSTAKRTLSITEDGKKVAEGHQPMPL